MIQFLQFQRCISIQCDCGRTRNKYIMVNIAFVVSSIDGQDTLCKMYVSLDPSSCNNNPYHTPGWFTLRSIQ